MNIKIPFRLSAIAAFLAILSATAGVVELDWCTLEVPDVAWSGKDFQIKLTPKEEIPSDCNISIHMHHVKGDGKWGGLYQMRPAQNFAGVGKPLVFTFTAKADSNVKEFRPVIFVAPNGNFNKQIKKYAYQKTGIPYRKTEAQLAREAARKRPEGIDFKKSRLIVERLPGPDGRFYRKGDTVTVRVNYHLDPGENWGDGTAIKVTPLGPWIDNPDGVVNKSRQHVFIYGFWPQDKKNIEPGDGSVEFTWKVDVSTLPYCDVSFMAQFIGGDGKPFPTQARGGGFNIVPAAKPIRVWAKAPGGLYKYGENIDVCCEFSGNAPSYVAVELVDDKGDPVYYGASLRVRGGVVSIPPPERRGVFLCRVRYGDKAATCFVATIPDVDKALGGKRAPFGCTNVYDDDTARAAAMLGFQYCRLFTGWAGLEPEEGVWRLDGLDKTVDRLNANGIRPIILLTGAPLWAIPAKVTPPGYEPFPFRDDAWRDAATVLAQRFKGRIWGFEWLNEIVPGNKSTTPVEDYARFCRIGTEAVKAVDPSLQVQLAGGLWPRNFRLDLLRAGVGKSIDVLPVHYGDYNAVAQAKEDFAIGGGTRVWDNECARGYSTWGMEPMAILSNSVVQCVRILRNWPGELAAGAEAIIYFGGEAAPAGNWTYLLDFHTPRPVAATLAVMASKLGRARPVGALYLDPGAIAYLFRYEDGGSLAFLMGASDKESCDVAVPVGAAKSVVVTDYAGNERNVAAEGGFLRLKARPMPVMIEGHDADALLAGASASVAGQGPLTPLPAVRFTQKGAKRLAVSLRNPYGKKADGTLSATLADAASAAKASFSLAPGESRLVELDLGPLADAAFASGAAAVEGKLEIAFSQPAAKSVRRFSANLVDPSAIGNIIRNGGMEVASGDGAAHWKGLKRVELDGSAPGYEGHAIEMRDNKSYASCSQGFSLPVPGIRYLYTAWVWTDGIYCGSNAGVKDANGKGRDYMIPSCFAAPKKSKGWVLASKVLDAVPGSVSAYVAPVGQVQGGDKGWARYDNVRVTAYEGTEFSADARRTSAAPKVDGDLAEWDFTDDPVPLCCENQVGGVRGGYAWSPANLSGVAAFRWDDEALYFAAKVKDDAHVTAADDKTPEGDAVTLALHPQFGIPGTEGLAQEWFLSDRVPGGGSGKFTLYRPEGHSAGQKSGQLAKDSSVYDIAVARQGDVTCYELRIPWSEIKGARPDVGAKIGLSLRLSDADEGGRFARINWGMGLDPTWSPASFGVLTLVP